ncbi:MAG TPA: YezD family protein [Verrucomicrobiota bacterium]|nr:YezD family protein [Verrucomicrobiota bacterium]
MNAERFQSEQGDVEAVADWLKAVERQVKTLRFGVVQIVVHDSRVVQIERTEKIRLDKTTERSH